MKMKNPNDNEGDKDGDNNGSHEDKIGVMEEGDSTENPAMHKTSPYIRTVVTLHNLRDRAKEAVDSFKEKGLSERIHDGIISTKQVVTSKTRNIFAHPDTVTCEHIPDKYCYIFRPKSFWELLRLSGTVCGIEFCYAAETAFVTPILLSLGLNIKYVTMIWCLSPLIGLFLTPMFGSMSDSCMSKLGRRRPFILMYSVGIIIGLILVPNGHHIGRALGDEGNFQIRIRSNGHQNLTYDWESFQRNQSNISDLFKESGTYFKIDTTTSFSLHESLTTAEGTNSFNNPSTRESHVQIWSIIFTVIGTILLDFCSDACQSPSRTYLLDVSLPEDHAVGLSTFTLMAGLGGSIGYMMGAIHWENTSLGHMLGGQINVVFLIVAIIFVICLISTVCSFPEIPLTLLKDPKVFKEYKEKMKEDEFKDEGHEIIALEMKGPRYGTTDEADKISQNSHKDVESDVCDSTTGEKTTTTNDISAINGNLQSDVEIGYSSEQPTLREYLKSIVYMPNSLRVLCLTNLFCWMSLVCYSLYFTDFVGESVFGGDPAAPEDSESYALYNDGVQFGCWGMALYSISCAVYSYFIESLVKKIGAKTVYIGGQLVYSVGMIIMAAARHKVAVILLSPSAGVMYATLFTMPYLLIAHYHCKDKFGDSATGSSYGTRGIGTDVAAVSSMVFLSQFILSLTMGSIVEAIGSTVATVCVASVLSACGAISAFFVTYLDV